MSDGELKRFLSVERFTATRKYVSTPEQFPRQFLTVGSANPDSVTLPDDPAMRARIKAALLYRNNVTVPVEAIVTPDIRDRLIGGAAQAIGYGRVGWVQTREGLELTEYERAGFDDQYATMMSAQNKQHWESDKQGGAS